MKAFTVTILFFSAILSFAAPFILAEGTLPTPSSMAGYNPEQPLGLTLPLAVDLALNRNPSFNSSAASDAIAESSLREARDRYSLQLDIAGGERRLTDQDTAESPSDRRVVDYSNLTLYRPFSWTGGQLSAFSELNRTSYFDGDSAASDSKETTHSYGLRLTQPLLKNAWYPISTAFLEQSTFTRQNASHSFDLARQRLILSVIEIYYSAVRAGRVVTVTERGLAESETHLQHSRIKFEEGLVARIDVSQADIQFMRQQTTLLSARQHAEESLDALRRLLFLPPDTPMILDESVDFEPETIDLDAAIAEALRNRLEFRTMTNELRSADIDVKVARNNRLPGLDLQLEARSDQRNDRFDNLVEEYPRAWSMELGFRWTLGDSAPREGLKRAQLRRQILQNEINALEREIIDEVKRVIRNYETLQRTIDVTRKSVELAEFALDLANQSYTEGLIRNTDLLKAQDDLLLQQNDYISAIMDFVAAKASVLIAIGRPVDPSCIRLNIMESPSSPQIQPPDDRSQSADSPQQEGSE